MSKHGGSNERELGVISEKIENITKLHAREYTTMGERIVNIEKSQHRVQKTLDNFIKIADKKYATKDELTKVVNALNRDNDKQDEQITWTKNKIFDMVYKLGMIAGIIFILFKVAI